MTYETREIGIVRDFGRYIATIHILEWEERDHGFEEQVGRKKVGQYVFEPLEALPADTVRGELPKVNGIPVAYIGNAFNQKVAHNNCADFGDVPSDLRDELREHGLTVVGNVDFGWASWEGRPEWSDSYVDYTDAEIIFE
jgi:hypothetical protein